MRKLTFSMSVSLDGYVNDANGSLDWTRVDEPFHRFANAQQAATGLAIYGTRMWQTMTYWNTAEETAGQPDYEYEFARLWKATPKLVVSSSLKPTDMIAGARLFEGDLVEAVKRLKSEPGKPITVAGPTVAGPLLDAGLVDEIQPFFIPVVLGGGTPFLQTKARFEYDLIETEHFASGVVFHRYEKR